MCKLLLYVYLPPNQRCLSFFSYRRTPDESAEISEGSQSPEERLTKEEWQAINKLLSNQPDETLASHSGKDMQNMIRFMVTVSVNQAAARIVDINQTEILCCKFEQLQVSTKFKHQSTYCDVSLRFYGLYAPEGSLAQVCVLRAYPIFGISCSTILLYIIFGYLGH